MVRKLPTSNTAVILQLSRLPHLEVESFLVRTILGDNSSKRIKNKLIGEIVGRGIKNDFEIKNLVQKSGLVVDIGFLEKFYELSVTGEDRKVNGAYFTPRKVVEHIVKKTILKKGTVCDPACGSGAFLASVTRLYRSRYKISFESIFSKYLFGVDILETNVHHVKVILSLMAIIGGEDSESFKFNIYLGDSLVFDWKKVDKKFKGFDFIIGNPPYVRTKNLRRDVRSNIRKWATGSFANADLYIPFFELANLWASAEGRIGYITPSTYLTAFNARPLREYLISKRLVECIIDFNGCQIFEGATTYTCITILDKRTTNHIKTTVMRDYRLINSLDRLTFDRVSYHDLKVSGWHLLEKRESQIIKKIENTGQPLHKFAERYVTGIATLDNELYLVRDTHKKYLKKEFEGKDFLVEREFTKKIIKPNVIKDKKALLENSERIIYPYLTSGGKPILMDEERIRREFPCAYQYLLAIKKRLQKRDGGLREYKAWYAYGRTQGIGDLGKKIIHPMMGNSPAFLIVSDADTLIYCGYAIFTKKEADYQILEKVLNSLVMWYYLVKTSKNYSGGYKSFAKNYVKNFSIPLFTDQERKKLLSLNKKIELDKFICKKYGLKYEELLLN